MARSSGAELISQSWYQGHDAVVRGDLSGDGIADFKLTVLDVGRLTADDFIFA